MKTTCAIALLAIGSVAAAPCDTSLVVTKLLPLATNPNLANCTTDSGYNFVQSASSGIPPNAEQIGKISNSTACKSLYSSLGGIIATLEPACSIGGVESTSFSSLPIPDAFAAIFKALGASSSNSTPTNVITTTKPSATTAAATTPAPKSSSVESAAISLAAVGLTIYAAAH